MGADHSVPSNRQSSRDLTSPPTTPLSPNFDPLSALSRDSNFHGGARGGRQDSVASDLEALQEVPYVSYTVNRPIGGESPKKKKPQQTSGGTTSKIKFPSRLRDSAKNTLVTVNRGSSSSVDFEASYMKDDPELQRLRDIPSFLPIMRASLSGVGAKDPDILERLDYRGLLSMTQRYEDHLRLCAVTVSSEQSDLIRSIKDFDHRIGQITQILTERQKQLARNSEKLAKVHEMTKCLSKCHMLLNENIEQMEVLNNMLPAEERLEPFVWTTG